MQKGMKRNWGYAAWQALEPSTSAGGTRRATVHPLYHATWSGSNCAIYACTLQLLLVALLGSHTYVVSRRPAQRRVACAAACVGRLWAWRPQHPTANTTEIAVAEIAATEEDVAVRVSTPLWQAVRLGRWLVTPPHVKCITSIALNPPHVCAVLPVHSVLHCNPCREAHFDSTLAGSSWPQKHCRPFSTPARVKLY